MGGLAKRENALKKYYENPNYCKCCGEIIKVKDDEKPSIVKQRMFCSLECRSKFQSEKMIGNDIRKYETNNCLNCSKQLGNHRKKYCDNKCQQEYQYNKYIEDWKMGLVDGLSSKYELSNFIKKYIKDKYNNKCCECGWNKVNPVTQTSPLEIHHIDGNYKNTTEDNLILLCPNCHSLTENYKALNKNGRKERYS